MKVETFLASTPWELFTRNPCFNPPELGEALRGVIHPQPLLPSAKWAEGSFWLISLSDWAKRNPHSANDYQNPDMAIGAQLVANGMSRVHVHIPDDRVSAVQAYWQRVTTAWERQTAPGQAANAQLTPSPAPPWPADALDDAARSGSGQDREPEPWQMVPDAGWDREAARLWYKGNSYREIGALLAEEPGTVANKITELRKQYGEQAIPFHTRQPKRRDIDRENA